MIAVTLAKGGRWAVIAFLVWFLVAQPAQAADLVQQVVGGLSSVATSLSTFVENLGQ